MKKLLWMLMSFTVILDSGSLAISCINNSKKIDLASIGEEDLNLVADSKTRTASERAVVKKIKEMYGIDVYKNLDFTDEYNLNEDFTSGTLEVIALENSNKLMGSVTFKLVFNSNYKFDLKDIIETKSLGNIIGSGQTPSIYDLLLATSNKNSMFKLSSEDIEIDGNPTTTNATLKAKSVSKKYVGSCEVTYNYKSDHISDNDLAKIKDIDKILRPSDNEENAAKNEAQKVIDNYFSNIEINTDYELLDFKEAKSSELDGSIVAKAKSDSEKVIGSVTFIVKYVEKDDRPSLKSLTLSELQIEPKENKQDSAQTLILELLKKKWNIENLQLDKDITFTDYKAPTASDYGRIYAQSLTDSTLIRDAVYFKIKFYDDRKKLSDIAEKDLIITPKKDNTESAVKETALEQINTKLGFNDSETKLEEVKHITFSNFTDAKPDVPGQIMAKAVDGNKFVSGYATFTVNYFDNRIDLSSISVDDAKIRPDNNKEETVKSELINWINNKYKISISESEDIDFSEFEEAKETSKPGSIKITAKNSSTKVKGSIKFTLTYMDPSIKSLKDITNTILEPKDNAKPSIIKAANSAIKAFCSSAVENTDYYLDHYDGASDGVDGKIEAFAKPTSKYLKKSVTFTFKFVK
ncbi:hypothetical protein SHELI_v1c08910 [Spiroplasma helicoides]|uniref:Uncharacterized protein n=1 Tax=Spiroplasma helicoides TaxID=216938 RepID=A0A1B3SLQ8_9MOLU|nr:hypothetical protein [Spiroplasma helicoides]AOG60840.1 hypothetical protein SHELI_v1c08910 [Spiroplasma helicoides]